MVKQEIQYQEEFETWWGNTLKNLKSAQMAFHISAGQERNGVLFLNKEDFIVKDYAKHKGEMPGIWRTLK